MPQEEDLVDYEICQDIESFTIVSQFPEIHTLVLGPMMMKVLIVLY